MCSRHIGVDVEGEFAQLGPTGTAHPFWSQTNRGWAAAAHADRVTQSRDDKDQLIGRGPKLACSCRAHSRSKR